jgi:acyl carrier protein phosphodiesterase
LNHLVHFLLAPQTVAATVGTLLADFHRGTIGADLPEPVAEAIALHRAIDSETDRHPALHSLKALFGQGHRRFAGLALDLYFDHCIARDWPSHADVPFETFIDETYARLAEGIGADYVPERMRGFVIAMQDNDWLRSYEDFAGVEAALGRLNFSFRRRFQRDIELRPLAGELLRLRDECDATFASLFPHLRIVSWRSKS